MKLTEANHQAKILDNKSNDVTKILDNLKPTKLNKNNMVISNEDVQKLKNYTEDVKDITKTVRSVNDLNMAISDFENSTFEIAKEKRSLKYQIELKEDEISNLKSELSTYEKFDNMLKSIDEEYRTTLINFGKYKLVMLQWLNLCRWKRQNKIKLHYICLIL